MPTLRSEDAGKTGKMRPARTASRRPFTRSSWGRVPFSKNSSISDSFVSATISTSFSMAAVAAAVDFLGHVHLLELAALVVGVHVGLAREQVRDTHEALLLAQGNRHRHHPAAESLLERFQGAREARRARGRSG